MASNSIKRYVSVQIVAAPAPRLTPVHAGRNGRSHTMVMNSTNLNKVLERYYLSPLYALEFCVGFPSNLVVVLGYIFCLQEWQSCNIYVFSLAISDLVFLCTLPHLSYLYANEQAVAIPALCVINRYVLHVNLYSSILFMVWISMDRFLLIKYPMRNHRLLRPRAAMAVTALTWLVVNVEVCPLITLLVQDLQKKNWSSCEDFASLKGDINPLGYSLGLTVTGYILPLLALCVFSQQISLLLQKQERAVQRRRSYKRPLRVVASATVMFLILYTPYHVLRNVRIASQQLWAHVDSSSLDYIKAMYVLTRPLAFLHSVINPVFYFLMGDKFRELLMSKLRNVSSKPKLRREPA